MRQTSRTPSRQPRRLSPASLAAVSGGFRNSDPSDANRLIERHDVVGNQGPLTP